MLTILDEIRRRAKPARPSATAAVNDDYRRGYLEGLRQHYRVGQPGDRNEYPRWLVFEDSPEYAEVMRGYQDGLAGIEPQP
jgi:hypothetical protein